MSDSEKLDLGYQLLRIMTEPEICRDCGEVISEPPDFDTPKPCACVRAESSYIKALIS